MNGKRTETPTEGGSHGCEGGGKASVKRKKVETNIPFHLIVIDNKGAKEHELIITGKATGFIETRGDPQDVFIDIALEEIKGEEQLQPPRLRDV